MSDSRPLLLGNPPIGDPAGAPPGGGGGGGAGGAALGGIPVGGGGGGGGAVGASDGGSGGGGGAPVDGMGGAGGGAPSEGSEGGGGDDSPDVPGVEIGGGLTGLSIDFLSSMAERGRGGAMVPKSMDANCFALPPVGFSGPSSSSEDSDSAADHSSSSGLIRVARLPVGVDERGCVSG